MITRNSRGVTLVEVGIAFLILTLGIVPMIGLLTGGREQATMSEHAIYAELASTRAAEDYATRHFGFLHRSTDQNVDFFAELQDIDKRDGESTGWWAQLTEFQQNAWKGVVPLKSKLTVEKGPDGGKGLMIIKVSASWADIAVTTKTKEASYHLFRLRAKRDYSLRTPEDAPDL